MEQKKSPPAQPLITRELGSWKEIADHLGVNVRTAQKWEKTRGLPIRRVSGPRGHVRSDSASLDVWQRQLESQNRREEQSYRWPLGRGLTVEVRFSGRELRKAHVELLREYLELVKAALC